jgi:hypothetical protein
MVERSGIIGVVVLFLVTLAFSLPSMVLGEVIYRSGDWVRYRYVIRTVNETCTWVFRITIEWVNETHVKYTGGLEGLVSGGGFCQSLTTLLILGLSLESEKPVELNTTTPASKRAIINPYYTGTYTYEKTTVTYHKGILISYYSNATTPVVGQYEAIIIDTSIEELKALIVPTTTPTTTITPPPTSTATLQSSPTLTPTTMQPTTSTQTRTTTTQATSTLTTPTSAVQTITTTPSGGVNTYLIFGATVLIIALLIAFLATRKR